MLARFLESHTVYLVCGYTDMRKSIDGLTSIVQQQFRLNPFVRGDPLLLLGAPAAVVLPGFQVHGRKRGHAGSRSAEDDPDLSNKEKAFADMSTEERQAAREKEETPIQEKFWQWIDANQGRCLPKSLLGKAFTYAQNQKDGLMNYLQYGNCDMTNNVAENSIRPFVVGRKNWEFSAAVKGAEASAAAYSIIETAKANGLDCRKYLTYLFEKLSQLDFRSEPDLFERFLPWQPEIQENCK